MSNFKFIKEKFPEVYEAGVSAEKYLHADGRACAMYCRLTMELMIQWLFANDPNLTPPFRPKGLGSFIYDPGFQRLVDRDVYEGIHLALKVGNRAAHGPGQFKEFELISALEAVFSLVKWTAHFYTDCEKNISFDKRLIPAKSLISAKLRENEILKIGEEFQAHFREKLEAARQRDAQEVARLKAELETLKNLNKKDVFKSDFDPSEAKTRQLYIDLLLQEVGWDLTGVNDKEYELRGMPTKSGGGYADYVLWGDNGKPLAVVEAKRTMRDAREGKQQAKLYADCLETMHGQRPIIFYTNGFETYLWDDQMYPERRVYGFYTKDELETLIERRHLRQSIDTMQVDKTIAGRPYQERAIRKVLEHFDAKHRRALLVMATGTGKTRTAVALVKCMTEANWAKRILFLADRTSLVRQAMKKSFRPLLPNLSMVNLVEEAADDKSRMVFSTYHTMINIIDQVRDDGTREYGVGHFDLIIVDESHRSVYDKFGAIFDYFDAPLIGLTATPKSELDKNTFEIFQMPDDEPTDVYNLKEAVIDGFLVDYKKKSPDLKFPKRGIKYAELSEADKKAYEGTFTDELTGEMPDEINGAAVNSWLFNKDTVRKVLEQLMAEGHRVEGGDKLGKTIVFCRSHRHAEFVVEVFDEIWPKYHGHFCQVIDNFCKNPKSMIDDFSEVNKMPQIAVSVDMLDTGIDVPEVVNLVFFRPVKSKSKFWQMIGRGTRLCPNLFGPGEDKQDFRIFDYCGNFEFFGENAEGFSSGKVESLSQRIFNLRARLACYLQDGEWQKVEATRELWQECVDWLHGQISDINADSALVRKSRRAIVQFSHKSELENLTDTKLTQLIREISPLPMAGEEVDELVKRFDAQMLNLMVAMVERSSAKMRLIRQVMQTAVLLQGKATIPAVRAKLPLLDRVVDLNFWQDANAGTANFVHQELRDLIKFLKEEAVKRPIFYTNFEDEFTGLSSWEDAEDYGDEFIDYKSRLRRYFDAHPEMESVWKLKNNQPLNAEDLAELESVVYSSEVSDRDKFEANHGGQTLTAFIRSLVGMDKQAVAQAFSDFLDENRFNAKQIDCIHIIIENFTRNGFMQKEKLREQPFSDFEGGVVGCFGRDHAIKLVGIIDQLNSHVG